MSRCTCNSFFICIRFAYKVSCRDLQALVFWRNFFQLMSKYSFRISILIGLLLGFGSWYLFSFNFSESLSLGSIAYGIAYTIFQRTKEFSLEKALRKSNVLLISDFCMEKIVNLKKAIQECERKNYNIRGIDSITYIIKDIEVLLNKMYLTCEKTCPESNAYKSYKGDFRNLSSQLEYVVDPRTEAQDPINSLKKLISSFESFLEELEVSFYR